MKAYFLFVLFMLFISACHREEDNDIIPACQPTENQVIKIDGSIPTIPNLNVQVTNNTSDYWVEGEDAGHTMKLAMHTIGFNPVPDGEYSIMSDTRGEIDITYVEYPINGAVVWEALEGEKVYFQTDGTERIITVCNFAMKKNSDNTISHISVRLRANH